VKSLIEQFVGLIGAGIAAACCLGIPAVLAALGAVGLGFVIHDAYLFPLFVGFASLSLWLLVTGMFPQPWLIYVGLLGLVAGSVWDFVNGRRGSQAFDLPATEGVAPTSTKRRTMTGAALSIAAAGAFYAMYKSVDVLVPEAEADEIACWGINTCKGLTACTTAFNSCTGQNECKGQGYLYASERECAVQGGVPLKGSEADPATL